MSRSVIENGMTARTMLHALFAFHKAMNERLWTNIMAHLTDAQFVQSDSYSRGSIRNQIVHMADAQHYWLRGLLDMTDLPRLRAEAYPTREAARAICQQADRECLKRIRALSQAELEFIPDGWFLPVWVALLQVAHHSTDHRAQILRALHDLGAPTFEQNFAVFMETVTPMSVEDLLGHIDKERAEWDALLGQVPADEMNQPLLEDWTVRDAVAIVMWKERLVVEMLRYHRAMEPSFGQLPEAEQASILEASRALPLPALFEQQRTTHREMLDVIQTVSVEELNAMNVAGMPPDEPFWKAIGGATWWSYPLFSAPLRRWLEAR